MSYQNSGSYSQPNFNHWNNGHRGKRHSYDYSERLSDNKQKCHGYSFFSESRSGLNNSNRSDPGDENVISDDGSYLLSVCPHQKAAIIKYSRQFIPENKATEYLEYFSNNLPWVQRMGKFRDQTEYPEPRMTCWYGLPYAYSGVEWGANMKWDPKLIELLQSVSNDAKVEFNSVMCNKYRDGKDSIGWHADDEPSLGRYPTIASITLGQTRTFQLRPKPNRRSQEEEEKPFSVSLTHGSLLTMEGAVQEMWQHRIPKEYDAQDTRINFTFRVILPESSNHRSESSHSSSRRSNTFNTSY